MERTLIKLFVHVRQSHRQPKAISRSSNQSHFYPLIYSSIRENISVHIIHPIVKGERTTHGRSGAAVSPIPIILNKQFLYWDRPDANR